MRVELLVGLALVAALTLYAIGGGADFGGGVWDLLARGPQAGKQRALIARAIGPVWEANHVWLILAVVLLFVAFPSAFASVSVALHVPLSILLVGIVLRGSAFVFRAYADPEDPAQKRWSLVFSVASTLTPLMLGICAGAVASGGVRAVAGGGAGAGARAPDLLRAWLAPFPVATGCLTLALFAFLAAVYLTLETGDVALREGYRRNALIAGCLVGVLAFVALGLARNGAPQMARGLAGKWWSVMFQGIVGLVSTGALLGLWLRNYRLARLLAASQACLIVWGWALSQLPYILPPDLTLAEAAAPPEVLKPLLVVLGAGGLLLGPSLFVLLRIFKSPPGGPAV